MGIGAAIDAVTAFLVSTVGVDAGIASVVAPALVGAGTGAVAGGGISAIEHKPVLTGALEGGLTGGAIGGIGPLIGGALGGGALATGVGDVAAGAGAGALGSAIAGQDPLKGAEGGAISGGLAGVGSALSGAATSPAGGTAGTTAPGSTASAAGIAAPGGAASVPVTSEALPPLGADAGSGGSLTIGSKVSGTPTDLGGAGVSPSLSSAADSIAGKPPALTGGSDPYAAGGALKDVAAATADSGGWTNAASSGNGFDYTKLLGPGAALLGVGKDLLTPQSPLPGQKALMAEANQLSTQGQQLQGYLQSGTLPPGVQQSLTSAADAAKATIRSRYAQMGGGTSAMQQELSNVDTVMATQGANIAQQLLQQGVSETQLSAGLYSQMLNLASSQDAALSSAIGNFATSLAGAGRPTVLQVQGVNG